MIDDFFLKPIMILAAFYLVFAASRYFAKTKVVDTGLYRMILDNSFGIYLYGDSLNYVILAIAYNTVGNALSTNELLSAGLVATRFVITLVGSAAISIAVGKLKARFIK